MKAFLSVAISLSYAAVARAGVALFADASCPSNSQPPASPMDLQSSYAQSAPTDTCFQLDANTWALFDCQSNNNQVVVAFFSDASCSAAPGVDMGTLPNDGTCAIFSHDNAAFVNCSAPGALPAFVQSSPHLLIPIQTVDCPATPPPTAPPTPSPTPSPTPTPAPSSTPTPVSGSNETANTAITTTKAMTAASSAITQSYFSLIVLPTPGGALTCPPPNANSPQSNWQCQPDGSVGTFTLCSPDGTQDAFAIKLDVKDGNCAFNFDLLNTMMNGGIYEATC